MRMLLILAIAASAFIGTLAVSSNRAEPLSVQPESVALVASDRTGRSSVVAGEWLAAYAAASRTERDIALRFHRSPLINEIGCAPAGRAISVDQKFSD